MSILNVYSDLPIIATEVNYTVIGFWDKFPTGRRPCDCVILNAAIITLPIKQLHKAVWQNSEWVRKSLC